MAWTKTNNGCWRDSEGHSWTKTGNNCWRNEKGEAMTKVNDSAWVGSTTETEKRWNPVFAEEDDDEWF